MSFQLFDRIRALAKSANLYRRENIYTDQHSLGRILSGDNFINLSTAGSLLEQTNLQINRLERYKDFDQMDEVGEITLALDMYADEGTLTDPELGHCLLIKAKRNKVKEELEDFFYNTIMIDNWARPAMRYLCKYGDAPFEIVPTVRRDGVASLRNIPIYNFTRIETKYGDLVGFFHQDEQASAPAYLHPWQVMHMRLTSFDGIYEPYGKSILDGARKHFKQLRLMEDAAIIYRLTRSAEKRVFTIPVGNIPTHQVPQYMEAIARNFKKKQFFDPASGDVNERWHPLIQEDDFWMPMRCFSPGTKTYIIEKGNSNTEDIMLQNDSIIPLMNSKEKTLKELVDEYGHMDKEFWVYSYDKETKKVVPAKAKACISPKNQQMVRVTIDNGESIECTPDHKFMTRDGQWIEAQYLQSGQSLMPLYRRKKTYYGKSDYEQLLHPNGKWEWTHKVALPDVPKNHVRHHKDFDRFNNDPDNLEDMHFVEHRQLHQEHANGVLSSMTKEEHRLGVERGIIKWNNDNPELRKKIASEGAKKAWREGKFAHRRPEDYKSYVDLEDYKDKWRELLAKLGGSVRAAVDAWNADSELQSIWKANKNLIKEKIIEQWGYKSVEEFCGVKDNPLVGKYKKLFGFKDHILSLVKTSGPAKAAAVWNKDSELVKVWKASPFGMSNVAKKLGWDGKFKTTRTKLSHEEILNGIKDAGSVNEFAKTSGVGRTTCYRVVHKAGYASIDELFATPTNHKVVSIEWLEEKQDTYCLYVPDTHCFFLSAGVLVHNSDGTGPTVDTLPGAENLDQIADIEYFKAKMAMALKIPLGRVGIGDPDPNADRALSQVSPEFARSIQHIQREVTTSLKKVAIVHLALKGYGIDDLRDFDIQMTASSAIDELYRIETWASRADVIDALHATELFPSEWILKRFTNMTEDEIKQMEEEKRAERERRAQEEEELGLGFGMGGFGGGGLGGFGGLGGGGLGGGPGLGDLGGLGEFGGGGPGGAGGPGPAEGGFLEGYDTDAERRMIVELKRAKDAANKDPKKFYNGYDKLLNEGEFDGLEYKDSDESTVIIESYIESDTRDKTINTTQQLLQYADGVDATTPKSDNITSHDLPAKNI